MTHRFEVTIDDQFFGLYAVLVLVLIVGVALGMMINRDMRRVGYQPKPGPAPRVPTTGSGVRPRSVRGD